MLRVDEWPLQAIIKLNSGSRTSISVNGLES